MLKQLIAKRRWIQATRGVTRTSRSDSHAEYHGQYHQDRFVAEFFDQKRNGFFVDIGANDGISFSNTYYFEKNLQWSGIAFEPHPDVYRKLTSCRACTVINAGVGPKNTILKFSCVDAGAAMLSGFTETFDKSHSRRIKRELRKHKTSPREIDVSTIKLQDVLSDYGQSTVDYLSLDTEGGELNILKSINFEMTYVRCLSVENNLHSLEIRSFLRTKGFVLVSIAGCDEIYVHNSEQKREHGSSRAA